MKTNEEQKTGFSGACLALYKTDILRNLIVRELVSGEKRLKRFRIGADFDLKDQVYDPDFGLCESRLTGIILEGN